jgi:hypothetical protein
VDAVGDAAGKLGDRCKPNCLAKAPDVDNSKLSAAASWKCLFMACPSVVQNGECSCDALSRSSRRYCTALQLQLRADSRVDR